MPDYAFSVFSGISFLLCFPPAYFNWKIPSRPYATLFLIGWIMVINLLGFVDSLIWRSENLDTWWDGKIYCDIDSRLRDMFVIGIPASTICICRFLGDATDPNPSRNDLRHGRNRRNLIDVSICLLLPLMVAAANFTFQSSRYHIVGVQGCTGWIDFSWPSVLFYPMWCPLLSVIAAIYAARFIRHWWIRRKRLNESWAVGMPSAISQSEFRRLLATVLIVIFVELPLSFVGLSNYLRGPKIPYSWDRVHGPMWKFIVFDPMPKATWPVWIGVLLAIISFTLVGFTRNARLFYGRCVEKTYDRLPQRFQEMFPWMQKVSEACKERRSAEAVVNNTKISLVEWYNGLYDPSNSSKPNRRKGHKHWFDTDDDAVDDIKTEGSIESSLAGLDEEKEIAFEREWEGERRLACSAEVVAGPPAVPGGGHGVVVTRQVLIETSLR